MKEFFMHQHNLNLNIINFLIGLETLYPNNAILKKVRVFLQPFDIETEKDFEYISNLISFLMSLELSHSDNRLLKTIRLLLQVLNSLSDKDASLYYLSELVQSLNETEDLFIKNLFHSIRKYPTAPWNDALSKGQLLSKIWLVDELKKINLDLGCVFVCAGWLGILPALMLKDQELRLKKIRSFDIDDSCADVADTVNKHPYVLDGWKFKASTKDILDIDYVSCRHDTKRYNGSTVSIEDVPDTVINTSCDHVTNFDEWWSLIPRKKLIIVQNNDAKGLDDDHVNTVIDLDDFKKQCPMQNILFEGTLELPKFNRYMLIGYK